MLLICGVSAHVAACPARYADELAARLEGAGGTRDSAGTLAIVMSPYCIGCAACRPDEAACFASDARHVSCVIEDDMGDLIALLDAADEVQLVCPGVFCGAYGAASNACSTVCSPIGNGVSGRVACHGNQCKQGNQRPVQCCMSSAPGETRLAMSLCSPLSSRLSGRRGFSSPTLSNASAGGKAPRQKARCSFRGRALSDSSLLGGYGWPTMHGSLSGEAFEGGEYSSAFVVRLAALGLYSNVGIRPISLCGIEFVLLRVEERQLWDNVSYLAIACGYACRVGTPRPWRRRRRSGRTFLVNDAVIAKICALSEVCSEQDTVLEVGPGIGTLTVALARLAPLRVLSVERDADLACCSGRNLCRF